MNEEESKRQQPNVSGFQSLGIKAYWFCHVGTRRYVVQLKAKYGENTLCECPSQRYAEAVVAMVNAMVAAGAVVFSESVDYVPDGFIVKGVQIKNVKQYTNFKDATCAAQTALQTICEY